VRRPRKSIRVQEISTPRRPMAYWISDMVKASDVARPACWSGGC
jgi:hypothetical protein